MFIKPLPSLSSEVPKRVNLSLCLQRADGTKEKTGHLLREDLGRGPASHVIGLENTRPRSPFWG